VQITVAESIGVGKRAGYFDGSGLLRDMFQNHMLQLFSLVAMEAPASFSPDQVRDEKVKLLRAVRHFTQENVSTDTVRGQYSRGTAGTETLPGYLDEKDVPADSATETYVAMKLFIDNWRWQGVPFYLRSGKRLRRKLSEIAICFKPVPHSIFNPIGPEDLTPNTLVIRVQPEEGVELNIQAKRPGSKLCMGDLSLDFNYREIFGGEPPDAYERLIMDAMLGDQTLFSRQDSVAESWELLMPLLDAWKAAGRQGVGLPLHEYAAGGDGPDLAAELLSRDGRAWRTL
jgi:glucose-6-phosphate 1-dehydrogenase